MNLIYQKCYLDPEDIQDRKDVKNPFLSLVNAQRVNYKIISHRSVPIKNTAVFYLHGLGGSVDENPLIEEIVCARTRLIRVTCYGLSLGLFNVPKGMLATFGDVCTALYNGRQSVYTIADILRLDSYFVVGRSWGGFIACLVALNDPRCKKAMLIASTPDICDALSRMYDFVGLRDQFRDFADRLAGKLRVEAIKAKTGHSTYQSEWDEIRPDGQMTNSGVEMLVFNRADDPLMRPWNVKHFIRLAARQGISKITAEFHNYPDLFHPHEIPSDKFGPRTKEFLFGKE
jgi:pimeloyl-ACP methyl ester carboxylesterase